MTLPSWLAERQRPDACVHDFSVERKVDVELPSYVQTPLRDRYCSKCGEKESLRHRMAAAAGAVPAPAVQAPPSREPRAQGLPDPIPAEDIRVSVDVEKFGKRYENDRKKGIKDKAINVGPDPRWTDAMAAAAEEYVAKALGLHFAAATDKPDSGWDMSMFGRRIQVKWTKYPEGKLLAHESQNMSADAYVLVTGATSDQFRIAGWATAKELKASRADLGYGVSFVLPQDQLRPFSDLLAIRLKGA